MDKLSDLLTKAAEQLGVAADAVYGVLLQQARVEFMWNVVSMVLLIVVAIILGLLAALFWRLYKEGDDWNDWNVGAVLCSIATVAVPLIGLPIHIRECVQIVVNPPVWVLEFLMKLING